MRKIEEKYTAKPEIEGCSSKGNIIVYEHDFDSNIPKKREIGRYYRNYSFLQTFWPFKQGDKEYALYSKDYTATRVMRLPSCEDLCGEEQNSYGFCPVEFYVPEEANGQFGFVAGCVWGDDTSWKIQFLDLSQIEQGILTRSEKFGYIQLPFNQSLKDAIDMCRFDPEDEIRHLLINTMQEFDLKEDATEPVKMWLTSLSGSEILKIWKYLEDKHCKTCGLAIAKYSALAGAAWACKCNLGANDGSDGRGTDFGKAEEQGVYN